MAGWGDGHEAVPPPSDGVVRSLVVFAHQVLRVLHCPQLLTLKLEKKSYFNVHNFVHFISAGITNLIDGKTFSCQELDVEF